MWDAGLELFFPTREARESLAKSASDDGVVVEMQFQFPTQLEKDEDSNEFDSGDGTDVRGVRARSARISLFLFNYSEYSLVSLT